MIDVIYDYHERVSQIEKYLTLVWILDNKSEIGDLSTIANKKAILSDDEEITLDDFLQDSTIFKIEGDLVKILKSNTILLLYNLIEGTISSVLNEFFGTLNREGAKYDNVQSDIKKVWLKYKHRSFKTGGKKEIDYIANTIESIFDEIVKINPKTIRDPEHGNREVHNYEAYIAETQANEVSGNLDARRIRELFKLYGLPEINLRCDSMVKVKNKRNSLAHGNETFAQVGSNFTVEELLRIKKEITGFLDILLSDTNTYLNEKKYLIPIPICVLSEPE